MSGDISDPAKLRAGPLPHWVMPRRRKTAGWAPGYCHVGLVFQKGGWGLRKWWNCERAHVYLGMGVLDKAASGSKRICDFDFYFFEPVWEFWNWWNCFRAGRGAGSGCTLTECRSSCNLTFAFVSKMNQDKPFCIIIDALQLMILCIPPSYLCMWIYIRAITKSIVWEAQKPQFFVWGAETFPWSITAQDSELYRSKVLMIVIPLYVILPALHCSVCLYFWMLWQLMYKQWTFDRIFGIRGMSIAEYLSS